MNEPVRKQDVRVILMGSGAANRIAVWNHYLHRRRVGKLVCYAVLHKGAFEGILIFALPPVNHPMFGFKPGEIAELARVYFDHNLKNMGSCSIRAALRRLPADWPQIRAVVSWCDCSRFDGALYKATGFVFMGKSRTRSAEPAGKTRCGGRQNREVQADRLNQKDIYLIKLTDGGLGL